LLPFFGSLAFNFLGQPARLLKFLTKEEIGSYEEFFVKLKFDNPNMRLKKAQPDGRKGAECLV
jgi:hypothetical protein